MNQFPMISDKLLINNASYRASIITHAVFLVSNFCIIEI